MYPKADLCAACSRPMEMRTLLTACSSVRLSWRELDLRRRICGAARLHKLNADAETEINADTFAEQIWLSTMG